MTSESNKNFNESESAAPPFLERLTGGRQNSLLLYFWIAVAGVSVGQGLLTSLKPGQSQDFYLVYDWVATWLWEGKNSYYWARGNANYPPHALVLLSPLTLMPPGWGAVMWAIINIALAFASSFIAFKLFKPNAEQLTWRLPCVMFLTWAGVRVGLGNGQWSLLMIFMGLLAVLVADSKPSLSGLFLAASLMKPHIGAAFFLWALLTRRFRATIIAVCIIGLGLLVYAARVSESPLAVTQTFLSVLWAQFGGTTFLGGVIELRPLAHAIISNFVVAEVVNMATIFVLLAIVLVVALKTESLNAKTKDMIVLQMCCMWALLSVFHNPYDSILLLPVLMCLWAAASVPHPLRSRQRQNQAMLWVLQLAMVIELPSVWWKLSQSIGVSSFNWAGAFFSHFDRLLVLGLFIYTLNSVRLYRLAQQSSRSAGEMLAPASMTKP